MTPKQEKLHQFLVKRVHCSKKWKEVYGHDRSLYESLLLNHFGVSSSKEMFIDDLIRLAAYMDGHGELKMSGAGAVKHRSGRSEKAAAQAAQAEGKLTKLITPKQRRFIAVLASRVLWKYEDGFDRWIKQRFGLDRVRTTKEASTVINGLMAMIKGGTHG